MGVLYNCTNCNSTVNTDLNKYFKEEHCMKKVMKIALALGSFFIIFLIAKSKNKNK